MDHKILVVSVLSGLVIVAFSLAMFVRMGGLERQGVSPNINPTRPMMCTEEALLCPDGSYVGRTAPNCEFAPCPMFKAAPMPLPITIDTPMAPPLAMPSLSEGSGQAEDSMTMCTGDIRLCPDGVNSTERVGPNCEFAPCPTPEL